VPADESLQHRQGVVDAVSRQQRVGEVLHGRDTRLFQRLGRRLRERLVRDVRQRRSTPQRERTLQREGGPVRVPGGQRLAPSRGKALEPVDVQAVLGHRQQVAGVAGHDRVVAQRASQRTHVHLQRLGGRRGWRLAPQPIDQALRGDHLVRMERQQREQRAWTATSERDHRPVAAGLDRAEQSVLHGAATVPTECPEN
jgi:hypothetical protein